MMMNLFTPFEPSTSISSLNWLILLIPILLVKLIFSKASKTLSGLNIFKISLLKEIKLGMKKDNSRLMSVLLLSIFIVIVLWNSLALFPNIFSCTTHIVINFSLAIMMWITPLAHLLLTSPKTLFTHLVPHGTPSYLIPMMTLIELVSLLIRPITLSVRLTANMTAGHLLLSLLGDAILKSSNSFIPFPFMVPLILLEMMVSLIQAYVFMTLVTLYAKE